jgi:hypothetical protein
MTQKTKKPSAPTLGSKQRNSNKSERNIDAIDGDARGVSSWHVVRVRDYLTGYCVSVSQAMDLRALREAVGAEGAS